MNLDLIIISLLIKFSFKYLTKKFIQPNKYINGFIGETVSHASGTYEKFSLPGHEIIFIFLLFFFSLCFFAFEFFVEVHFKILDPNFSEPIFLKGIYKRSFFFLGFLFPYLVTEKVYGFYLFIYFKLRCFLITFSFKISGKNIFFINF